MRLVLIASLLAAGCTEQPASGPSINSFVAYYDFPGASPPRLDMLIVVDNTAPMSPYQSSLAALSAIAEAMLYDPAGIFPDFRIMVTTTEANGALRQPTTTTDVFLERSIDTHYALATNFTGSLTDALAPMLAVGTSSNAPVRPLEAAKLVLDANAALLRDYSYLVILTLAASDDASPGAVGDYAASLKARKADGLVVLSSIYDLPAPRLDAFHAQFPTRTFASDIETVDIAQALNPLELQRSSGHFVCFRQPADVDAQTAGPQYDCDFNAYYGDDTTEPVRPCAADSTEPCFEFAFEPQCFGDETTRFKVRGFPTRHVPAIRGQCVVTNEN